VETGVRAIPTLPVLVVPLAAVVYLSGCSSSVIIDGDPIVRVLRKDAIRSIDRPDMVTVTEADALMLDEQPVLGVFDGKEARAYSALAVAAVPLGFLEENSPLNAHLDDESLLVVSVGSDGAAFRRSVDGRTLEFESAGVDRLRDRQTASLWDVRTGRALEGPLAGRSLDPLDTRRGYWFVWAAFYPQTRLLGRDTWID
jgi:hypothetical protein